ncbi:MAG: hypothetical protein AAF682_19885 [Planctomycetota bacterium]
MKPYTISLLVFGLLAGDLSARQSRDAEPWREDHSRLRRKHERCMSPAQYRLALESTGMGQALAQGRGGGATAAGVAAWQLLGPVGAFSERNGRVSGIQILDGVDPALYVGICQGGLWKSTVGTAGDWTSIGDALPNPSVRAFAVDPKDEDHILVGTGDVQRYKGAGMFESNDGGLTWDPVNLGGADPEHFFRIFYKRSGSNIVYAASSEGLFRSVDDGASWSLSLAGNVTDVVIHPTLDRLYACRRGSVGTDPDGIWRSLNDGFSWSHLSDPDLPALATWSRAHIALCRDAPDTLAVIVEASNILQGVYRSTDGGDTWDDATGDLEIDKIDGGQQAGHALAIAIEPTDPDTIYVGSVRTAKTTDGGTTWAYEVPEKGHADVTQLYFNDATGDDLWICNDGGIYLHAGGNTTHKIGGANGLACSEIDFLDADRAMIALGLQDNGTVWSDDDGQAWDFVGGGDGADVEVYDALDEWMWFVDGVYAQPVSWRTNRLQHPASSFFSPSVTPANYQPRLFYDRYDDRLYTHDETGLWYADATASAGAFLWSTVLDTGFQADSYSIRAITGSKVDGSVIWVDYWGDNEDELTVLSKNGAGAWSVLRHIEQIEVGGSPIEIERVLSVAPSTEWPGEAWVALRSDPGSPKILHTRDYGATWADRTGGLDVLNEVNTIAPTPFHPDVVYAGTDLGVFRSTDGGASWIPFQQGLPIARCKELRFVVDDSSAGAHRLILGTDGRGAWRFDVPAEPIVYVDHAYTGALEDGSLERPYKTVAAANAAALPGSIVALRAGAYQEPQLLSKGVRLVTWAGASSIQ